MAALIDDLKLQGPADISDHPAVTALGGLAAALGHLHARWINAFGVAFEVELEAGAEATAATAWAAWSHVYAEAPALGAVLWRHRDHTTITVADRNHQTMLSALLGVAPTGLPSFARTLGWDRVEPRSEAAFAELPSADVRVHPTA